MATVLLTKKYCAVADYEPLGLYWESLGGTWGGRFDDAPHFSLAHDGMK